MSDKRRSDDADLWRQVTADVQPLRRRQPAPERPTEAPDRTRQSAPSITRPVQAPTRRALPELSQDRSPGLDKRTRERLKRGQLPIEARVDLHGHTQDAAHRALSAFILGAHEAGIRCVLVITGKGMRPDGGTGVLRAQVPRWLNHTPNRDKILAFSSAQPKDGGDGAFYVLLKRKR